MSLKPENGEDFFKEIADCRVFRVREIFASGKAMRRKQTFSLSRIRLGEYHRFDKR
jgi:hypothetical protein